jgi:VanZ family protein
MLVLAGVGIEIYQSFLPARQASVEDLIANVVGIMLGLCVGRLIRRLYHSHH